MFFCVQTGAEEIQYESNGFGLIALEEKHAFIESSGFDFQHVLKKPFSASIFPVPSTESAPLRGVDLCATLSNYTPATRFPQAIPPQRIIEIRRICLEK